MNRTLFTDFAGNIHSAVQDMDITRSDKFPRKYYLLLPVIVAAIMVASPCQATGEQKRGGEQIVKAVDNIAQISAQNKDITAQIVAAVEQLSRQGEELRKITGTFKL